MNRHRHAWTIVLLVAAMPGCTSSPSDASDDAIAEQTDANVTFRASGADAAWARRLLGPTVAGMDTIAAYLGTPFSDRIIVTIYPTRSALTDYWRVAWNAPAFLPECWMVAAVTGDGVSMLSPARWATEACGNIADSATVVRVVRHELVHVLHLDLMPALANDMRWFFEGLATLAAGQYGPSGRDRARTALRDGPLPRSLADLASGTAAYTLAPSMVEFVEQQWGRERIRALLGARTTAAALGQLEVSEQQLLADWIRWLD